MSVRPTASKTDLLLGCQRPFAEDTPTEREEPGEAAEYGTTWHRAMAQHCDGTGVVLYPPDSEELANHVERAWAALAKWLEGKNPWNEPFEIVGVESSQAMRVRHSKSPAGISVRDTTLDEETHTYDLLPKEIGGTYDLLLQSESGRKVVLDHKTGEYGDFHIPSQLGQLKTLALMTGATGVAILHSPREAPTIIYAEDVAPEILQSHAKKLRLAMARIGDGSMRPGPWCKYCPAKTGCPAQDGQLLTRASAIVRTVTESDKLAMPVDKGAFHLFLAELATLAARGREELRNAVREGEIIHRPDGKVLVLKSKTTERLSKASVIRALGKQKGEAMLSKLRKMGAVEEETHDELWAVNEK